MLESSTCNRRELAVRLFQETLAEIAPERQLAQWVQRSGDRLIFPRAGSGFPSELNLARYRSILVLSLGKAAGTLWRAWRQVAGPVATTELVAAPQAVQAEGEPRDIRLRAFVGGHPEPNGESLRAGRVMLEAVRAVTTPALVVYLVSGGGSALVESPLAGLTLDELRDTYRALVLSGASITDINVIRKHLSAFKGGRLAEAAASAGDVDQISLLISDVPQGELGSISSGPTCPDASTVDDCYRLYQELRLELPPRVARLFEERRLEETPNPGAEAFARAHWQLIMDNERACEVLAERARRAGLHPHIDHTADEWEYRRAARYLVGRLRELQRTDAAACLIAGGEVRVRVEGEAGRGGRNQELALEAATLLADSSHCLLSCGTDGVDGNSPAAGAAVDGTTVARALDAGMDPVHHLRTFDAWPLLHSIGDSIEIGPTGQNVRDLRLLL